MDSFVQDIRYALRGLARSPGFTLAVVVTLALGIGANTTMFGVLDRLLLKPPAHVRDASRVQRVYFRVRFVDQARINTVTSFPGYESLRSSPGLSAVAAVSGGGLSVGTGPEAQQVTVSAVSASFFPLLGVTPERGRFFDSTEDQVGAAPVAVVSHAYWKGTLHGDSAAIGKTLPIGRFSYTIIGVAPEEFAGADLEPPNLWIPIKQAAPVLTSAEALASRNWFWVGVLARLAPGATPRGAEAQATMTYRRAAVGGSSPMDTAAAVLLGPIQAARGPDMSSDAKVALWVGIVALAVLLVACANVANLLLARGLRRRTEMAVRSGLGAGRGRLVRQLLVESVVLALAGGAAALLVALWGGAVARAYLLPSGSTASLFDLRVLGFTAAVAIVTGLLAGSAPAWQSSRTDVASALRAGGREVHSRGVLRSALLAIQVALTLVLLVGAGLFVRSLRNVQTLDYGLDLQHLLIAGVRQRGGSNVSISRQFRTDAPSGPEDPQSAMFLRLMEKIRTSPTVASADVTVGTPYQSLMSLSLRASGRDSMPRLQGGGPYIVAVSPGYFATVGTRILRGRGFTDQDIKGAMKVTVVGQSFAKVVWPDRDALGQCLYIGRDSSCVQVVGIAADARRQSVVGDQALTYYVPFAQHISPLPVDGLLIRTRGPARAVQGEIQRALQNAEPNLPFVSVQSLLDRIEPQWRSWRLGATMLTAFGLLALVIAALGLYGVTAYGVTQRTQEIGVRVALGAQRADVIRLSVAQAVRATAIGAAIGLAIAYALGRAVASLLYGVKPADPTAVLGGVAVLLAVAAFAAYVPARRAARIDPMEALRYE